jgi:hypothetical protein
MKNRVLNGHQQNNFNDKILLSGVKACPNFTFLEPTIFILINRRKTIIA